MNGLRVTLILMGLIGLVSANGITVDPAEKFLKKLEAHCVSEEKYLSPNMLPQVQALLERSRNAESCNTNLIVDTLGLVDNQQSPGVPSIIREDVGQFRKDKFIQCSGQFAKKLMEEVSRLPERDSELINKLRTMVESENHGESLLPVIPDQALIEGSFKFVVQQDNLLDLKSKSAYLERFKETFSSSVTEVCKSINNKLNFVKVYDHFIYDRIIYGPNSSLLGQIDPQAKDWITNYHMCVRLLTDAFLRPKDFADFAKTKFTGQSGSSDSRI